MRNVEDIREQIGTCTNWLRISGMWYGVHYIFGFLAIVLSVTVASKPIAVEEHSSLYSLLAWGSALATAIVAFLQPLQKGDRALRARNVLLKEITRYRADSTYTVDHVLAAVDRGEDIIHQVPTQDAIQPRQEHPSHGSVV